MIGIKNVIKRKSYLYFRNLKPIGTLEIKQELQQFIKEGDETFIKMLYESAKDPPLALV